jgi:hypothetical protein
LHTCVLLHCRVLTAASVVMPYIHVL